MAIISFRIFFLTFLFCPYSPYFRYTYSYDEVCYKIVTEGIFRGKLPYRDLFDHKGPLTYLIFAAGYLLTGKHKVGMWIISAAVDSLGFIFAYKTSNLRLEKNASLFSALFLLFMNTVLFNLSIMKTGSKPDGFVFTLLMISAYIFLKESSFSKKTSGDHVIGLKPMFLLGLLCGGVFMIKLNACFFYLAFAGSYFLWLLIRKKPMSFLKSCGLFLAGIITVSAPFFIFYAAVGGLKDLIDIYFVFNSQYGTIFISTFLSAGMFTWICKVSLLTFAFLSVIAFLSDISRKKNIAQKTVMAVLAVIVFVVLTASPFYSYFFIVFSVFFVYGTDHLAVVLSKVFKGEKGAFLMSLVLVFIALFFAVVEAYAVPLIPRTKKEHEEKIESYAREHPDADYMFFACVSLPMYDEYLKTGPQVRQFYATNNFPDEMVTEQFDAIKEGKVDVVIYPTQYGEDPESGKDGVIDLIRGYGYHDYQTYISDDGVYYVHMLVRED